MPRRSKGPRLYLREGRTDARTGRPLPAIYFIRDGQAQQSTGCGPDRLHGPDGAEAQLAAYIAAKWAPENEPAVRSGDPAAVLVAEVLAFYVQRKAPKLAGPADTASRVGVLMGWWGEDQAGRARTLADVKMSTCEAYIEHRTAQPWKHAKRGPALEKRVTVACARRELEDLSAAIGFWAKEYPLHPRPIVSLPPKPESPRDALTRDQAAALLKAAMGWRWSPSTATWARLGGSARANRAHVRRFILLGLYTGTRPGVLPKLLWHESPTSAWVDLDAGVVYRRGKAERDHRTKRRPLVRVPDRLLAHMRRWRAADLALQARRSELDAGLPPLLSVLHHGGVPIDGRIRRAFASCVRDAGLPAEITPHWMRHTCATWLMESDVAVWDAAAYAGMSTATLEKVYGHHRSTHQDRARKALGRSA